MPRPAYIPHGGALRVLHHVLTRRVDAPFFVDIGCAYNPVHSNVLPLHRELGWSGIGYDADPARAKMARTYLRFPVEAQRITPATVPTLARTWPRDIGVLSLDIDGYDYPVLDTVLAHRRPALLICEVNEKLPPPIRMRMPYREGWHWTGGHLFGCSTAALADLCADHGYVPVELHYNNLIAVRADFAPADRRTVADLYREGYVEKPDRREIFPWNVELQHYHTAAPADVVADFCRRLAPVRDHFEISLQPLRP